MEVIGKEMTVVSKNAEFQNLLTRIRQGHEADSSEMVTFLLSEETENRLAINMQLSDAYASAGNFHQARVFIDRAWVLSKFSPEILPRLIHILSSLNDVDAIRQVYKRSGMREAALGDISAAIKYFNLWQYAYAHQTNLDRYEYDFDVLECMERIAKPLRFPANGTERSEGEKIKLAYLTFGITHENSVLSKISRILAEYHNKELFDVSFFIPESRAVVRQSKDAGQTIGFFQDYGCKVVVARNDSDLLRRLLDMSRRIHEFGADVMITSALLADFETYFVAALRPSPLVIGLLQGPPPQFAAPSLDWAISWSKHPAIEAPCNCSLVQLGFDLPDLGQVPSPGRAEMGIPSDAQIIMSAGRYVKFQNEAFWKSILEILSEWPKVYYVAVGVTEGEIPFFGNLGPSEMTGRIRLLGWRTDVVNLLGTADLLIDTFPSGGGHVLGEAMALGVPCVSFANDYRKKFDQTDWSVGDEYIGVAELLLPRGNFQLLKEKVSALLSDRGYRDELGKRCKKHIQAQMKLPAENVKKYEECILAIMRKTQGAVPEGKTRRVPNCGGSGSRLGRLVARFRKSQ